jgi:methyltransferase (TIGR00027 family)
MSQRRIERRPSTTAQINATQRAAEMQLTEGERLFSDEYARCFVSRPVYRLLAAKPVAPTFLRVLDRMFPGLQALILLRTRFAFEVIRDCQRQGIDQVVLLGAGFDSIAFQLPPPAIAIYEVDAPPTQVAKRRLIGKHGLVTTHRLVLAPCDFESRSFIEQLANSGFDSSRPAVFVWLGVTIYLSIEAFRTTLDALSACAAPGSRLVLDYMDPAVVDRTIDNPGPRRMARAVARRGEPYTLGFRYPELATHLRNAGFSPGRHLRIPDLGAYFGGERGVWCRTDDWMGVVDATKQRSATDTRG